MNLPSELEELRYCVLSTQARGAGRRHSAELWFVPTDGGVYLMSGSGGLTQWCLNLEDEGHGVLRFGSRSWLARAALLEREDPLRVTVLEAFHDRYDPAGKDRTAAWILAATVLQMVFTREL